LLSSSTALDLAEAQAILVPRFRLTEFEIIARRVSGYRTRVEAIEKRLDEVEREDARLESAALTTSHVRGVRMLFSCCKAVFADQPADSISAFDVVGCR
jgi:hypothetical protein